MKDFLYFEPSTVKEASGLLSQYGNRAALLAGGTDLLRKMRKGLLQPEAVISTAKLEELKFTHFNPETGLHIGAGTTICAVGHFEETRKYYPALIDQIAHFGTPQVRSVGTIAGNVCNASPAGDFAPILLALGAEIIVAGPDGERELSLAEFFTDKGQTSLRNGELLKEIVVPAPKEGNRVGWDRHTTREMLEVTIVGVAVWLQMENETCHAARIGLGSVAPVPIRGYKAEQVLLGKQLTSELKEQVVRAVLDDIRPINDFRASAEYRKNMVQVYLKRVLEKLSN